MAMTAYACLSMPVFLLLASGGVGGPAAVAFVVMAGLGTLSWGLWRAAVWAWHASVAVLAPASIGLVVLTFEATAGPYLDGGCVLLLGLVVVAIPALPLVGLIRGYEDYMAEARARGR